MADWRTSGLFGEAERLAFELADATIETPVEVTDDVFARLQRHYTTEQLVDLGAICALENFRGGGTRFR